MRWLVVLAVCACRAQPRIPDEDAPRHIEPPRLARVPRPPFAFEPFRDELSELAADDLRWPLTRAPALEPHAPIAALYRSSSDWASLCDARRDPVAAVDRDEMVDYLQAWCGGTEDLDRLRDALEPLTGAKTWLLARAGRLDLVDVLAFQRIPARDAAKWLQAAFFDRLALDALAVTYELLGRSGDEETILAMQMQSPLWSHTADCRVMYRVRRLSRDPTIRDAIEERKPNEPICERVADALDREDSVRHCALIAGEHPQHDGCDTHGCEAIETELRGCGRLVDSLRARVAIAYLHWPRQQIDSAVWVSYARFALATNDPGGDMLAAAAVENAALVADCTMETQAVREIAGELRARTPTPALDYLAGLTIQSCRRRFSPTLGR